MNQIVLAYTPTDNLSSYTCAKDDHWYYEPDTRFYDTGCKVFQSHCPDHKRNVGYEPYYNLTTQTITDAPRIYIAHLPKRGEHEHLKTVEQLLASELV